MSTATNIDRTTPSLKLTRKGRRVLQTCIGFAGLVVTALIVGTLWFQQPLSPAAATDDMGSGMYEQIVVQPGDTLWGISIRLSDRGNHGAILEQIVSYNDLESSDLEVGQVLYIPVIDAEVSRH